MISRRTYILIVALLAAVLVAGVLWVWPFVRGIWPAIGPVAPIPTQTTEPDGEQSGPLQTLEGWEVSILADGLPSARDIAEDFRGNLWVSQRKEGTVSLLTFGPDGELVDVSPVLRGLDKPHGLAFDPDEPFDLYVATETQILRVRTYSGAPLERIADLPKGGRHTTRSLAFGPDGRLYVSIGSTCDVCREKNPEHGSIISMEKDGSDRRFVARGLRNAVFITFDEGFVPGRLWVTEMGRDNLGDDLPPDEVNLIDLSESVGDYGGAICYGTRVHDSEFDKNQYIRDPCEDTRAPVVNLPAHVAPLGLEFMPDGSLLVALHGSWNSSIPVGYEVIRMKAGPLGYQYDEKEVFLTGFLKGGAAIGRPVDVLVASDGTVYISDDKAGVIWKMERR